MAHSRPGQAPFQQQPGQINRIDGGRGVYFDDPDGHMMEVLTCSHLTAPPLMVHRHRKRSSHGFGGHSV
jgi:hypothetical protein